MDGVVRKPTFTFHHWIKKYLKKPWDDETPAENTMDEKLRQENLKVSLGYQ